MNKIVITENNTNVENWADEFSYDDTKHLEARIDDLEGELDALSRAIQKDKEAREGNI